MSFDVDNFVERNYTEEEVYEDIEGEGLYLLVHPGFGLHNDEYKELGLTMEDHFRFSCELWTEVEKMVASDYEIAVLHEFDSDYSEEFLGKYAEDVDHWFETQRGEAKLMYRNADEFLDFVTSLEPGTSVVVAGELRNLCEGQAREILDYVAEKKDLDIELERGATFPDRPLTRDDNQRLKFA